MSNEKTKQAKSEKGITLVALIITVVVMLILAGVAIAAVVDGDGLFSKTRQAAETYENATDEESYMLTNLIGQIDHYIKDETNGSGDISEEEEKPIISTISVGDFVNYDAGTWTEDDFNKITNSAGNPTVNKSTSKPTMQGEFGGFTVGQSRNINSTEYSSSYTPDESTGEITLISAGHPETYYHGYPNYSEASTNILKNRDCSMYENEYAKSGSAHILTGQEAVEWYNKQFNTNYTLIDNNYSDSTFYMETFINEEPINVLENGAYYWLASPYDANYLYIVSPYNRYVNYGYDASALGVRILVSLKSDIQVKEATTTEGITTWDIVED